MKFGIPRVITTDQGSEFNNKLDSELMTLLNVDHHRTAPYHPQVIILYVYNITFNYYFSTANSPDEQFNQTMQKVLVKYAKEGMLGRLLGVLLICKQYIET